MAGSEPHLPTPSRRRALGVDFGERRIGLALSDPEGRMAVPLTTVERHTDRRAAAEIADLARRHGATVLVVGEPRRLDGRAGDAAARARRFAAKLEARAGLPVVLVDEALTSVEAERRLAESGADAHERHRRVDAVAAQILLQEALDRGLVAAAGASGGDGDP